MWLQISDTDFPQSMNEIATIGKLNQNILNLAKKHAETTLNELFKQTSSLGCDIFETKNMLYRFHNAKFEKHKNDLLDVLKCRFEVTCRNYI